MTDEAGLKVHYQMLKARCLELALGMVDDVTDEAGVVVLAKRLYNEITGEAWAGEGVADHE